MALGNTPNGVQGSSPPCHDARVMDTELVEIRDFLAQHAPFDTLPPPLLDRLPAQLEVRYFRRGTVILQVGQPTDVMYVLRSGAVDIRDRDGNLVERAESGTSFAMSALLQGTSSAYEFTAIEDSLVLAVPAAVFHALCQRQPETRAFFDRRGQQRRRAASAPLGARGASGLKTAARDLVHRAPEGVSSRLSIREAAETMRERGVSSLLVMDGDRLVGIVTDRDLRNRVLAQGRDPAGAVATIMTAGPGHRSRRRAGLRAAHGDGGPQHPPPPHRRRRARGRRRDQHGPHAARARQPHLPRRRHPQGGLGGRPGCGQPAPAGARAAAGRRGRRGAGHRTRRDRGR